MLQRPASKANWKRLSLPSVSRRAHGLRTFTIRDGIYSAVSRSSSSIGSLSNTLKSLQLPTLAGGLATGKIASVQSERVVKSIHVPENPASEYG